MDSLNHTPSKQCRICSEIYPSTTDYFVMRDNGKLDNRCNKCRDQYNHEYHAEKLTPSQKEKKERRELLKNGKKRCVSCRNIYPATPEYFHHRVASPDGLSYKCSGCSRESAKDWVDRHPKEHNAHGHGYRARERNNGGTHTAADVELQIKAQTDKRKRLHCWWCGKVIKGQYHVDHKVPLVRGGSNAPENLCVSCPKCNQSKGAKLPSEWSNRLL